MRCLHGHEVGPGFRCQECYESHTCARCGRATLDGATWCSNTCEVAAALEEVREERKQSRYSVDAAPAAGIIRAEVP